MSEQLVNPKSQNEYEISSPPSGFQVIIREFKKDKLAMFSLVRLIYHSSRHFYSGPIANDQDQLMKVSPRDKFAEPGEKFFFGADQRWTSIS